MKDQANKLDPHKGKQTKEKCGCSGNSIVRSEGEMIIVVVRTSFNIPMALPYCIWGTLYLQNNSFAVPLQSYLPAGVTVVTNQDLNVLTFQYTDSFGNSDSIQVFMPPQNVISYFETLTSLNTNFMRSELVYYNCNVLPDAAPLLTDDQLNTLKAATLYLQKIRGAGTKTNEAIVPLSRNIAGQSDQKITEIYLKHQEIKPETLWIHNFEYIHLGGLVTFLVNTWTVMINERIDMNAEKIKAAELFK